MKLKYQTAVFGLAALCGSLPAVEQSTLDPAFRVVRQSAESPASLYDWTVVDRPDGSQHLVLTYRRDSLLVSVDLATGKSQQIQTEGFGYGLTTRPDGRVFIGTSMSPGARVFEYDIDANSLTELAQVDGEMALFWLHAAPDGRLYGGTYPGCLLVRYDPETGVLENPSSSRFLVQRSILCGIAP